MSGIADEIDARLLKTIICIEALSRLHAAAKAVATDALVPGPVWLEMKQICLNGLYQKGMKFDDPLRICMALPKMAYFLEVMYNQMCWCTDVWFAFPDDDGTQRMWCVSFDDCDAFQPYNFRLSEPFTVTS